MAAHFKQYLDLFQQEAAKRSGTVKKTIYIPLLTRSTPILTFIYKNCTISIQGFLGGEFAPSTCIDYNIEESQKLDFSIYRKSFLANKNSIIDRILMVKTIDIGNFAFDSKYIIEMRRGKEDIVRFLITPAIQDKLIGYNVTTSNFVNVNTLRGKWRLNTYGIPETEKEFDKLIDIATMFFERFREVRTV